MRIQMRIQQIFLAFKKEQINLTPEAKRALWLGMICNTALYLFAIVAISVLYYFSSKPEEDLLGKLLVTAPIAFSSICVAYICTQMSFELISDMEKHLPKTINFEEFARRSLADQRKYAKDILTALALQLVQTEQRYPADTTSVAKTLVRENEIGKAKGKFSSAYKAFFNYGLIEDTGWGEYFPAQEKAH